VSDRPGTSDPRQRWRLVVARAVDAPVATQRESSDSWIAAIEDAGLPLTYADGDPPRPRISFGAPLQVGMAAEGELIDLVLHERWPAWRVREAVAPRVPDGWRLVDQVDVWLAGPPLAGRVAAADYRIELAGAPDAESLRVAAGRLLAERSITRERQRGGTTVSYDLRPLLIDVAVEPGPPTLVRTRTRFHPELGTGRPEEVLAALADAAGTQLESTETVRERLLLVEDLDRA
jgi:radical SAM-linked protein